MLQLLLASVAAFAADATVAPSVANNPADVAAHTGAADIAACPTRLYR